MAAAALGRLMADFNDVPADEVIRLVGEAPLCWIVPHADVSTALLMPVIAERAADGSLASLLGHLPKRASVTALLRSHPRASFLFLGVNGYISPAMVGRNDWGPTWNFASARIEGDVLLDDKLTCEAVGAITRHMEGPDGWSLDRLGARIEDLLARIIGFRVEALSSQPRFKLGQDEGEADLRSICSHLGHNALGQTIRRFMLGEGEAADSNSG